jgi:hypothetical protein
MSIQMFDSVVVDAAKTRRTRDGYLLATPRVARTGIQEYLGSELGRPDLDRVKVYRSPKEVFSPDSLRSYAHKPVTNDHPPVPVNEKNWKKYAVGHTGDEIARDGDCVRVPMMVADSDSIFAVDEGKIQLSLGYSTELDWTPGVFVDSDGTKHQYDALQTQIRANHLAIVKKARGGDRLKMGDEVVDDAEAFRIRRSRLQDGMCPKCGKEMAGKVCDACGYTRDDGGAWTPGLHPRVPAGSPSGGQFASAGEAQASIDKNRATWKRARVEKVEEIRRDVPKGILAFLKPTKKRKTIKYVVKTDEVPVELADEQLPDEVVEVFDGEVLNDDPAELPGAAESLSDAGDNSEGDDTMPKTIMVDGISCEMTDMAAQVVRKVLDERDAEKQEFNFFKKKKEDEDETYKKDHDSLTAEVQTLKAQLATTQKQLADSQPTPQMLDQMVAERNAVVAKSKTIIGDKLVVDGKTASDIRRQVVDSIMGDSAKAWTDDQIAISFATLATPAATGRPVIPGVTDVATGFGRPAIHAVDTTDAAYKAYDAELLKGRAN